MSRQDNRENRSEPAYLQLYSSGRMAERERVKLGLQSLEHCHMCPWGCGINRLQNEYKIYRIGRYTRVASYFPLLVKKIIFREGTGATPFSLVPAT